MTTNKKNDFYQDTKRFVEMVFMNMREEIGALLKENFDMSRPSNNLLVFMSILTILSPLLMIGWGYWMMCLCNRM